MRSPKLIATGTASISMTPMIDVVFLLIIFFLVSSHLSRQENLVPLKLPSAASGLDEVSDRDTVIIHVLETGTLMASGTTVGLAELESFVQRRIAESERPIQLRIRTDKTVPYARLSPILEIAARLGVGDVVFSVFAESAT